VIIVRARLLPALLVCCVASIAPAALRAAAQQPLPGFSVSSPEGGIVAAAELSREQRWLMVYVEPNCRSCDRLVSALVGWQRTLPPGRIVVVIGGGLAGAQAYARERGLDGATGITWYADPDRRGASALGLQHLPSLVAVESGRIGWVLSGVLNDPGAVESAVTNWTAR
jgi:hypothetical protein